MRQPAGRQCDLDGCDQPHRARGLCARHWAQMIAGRPYTNRCTGLCRKPHPLNEPPDPPLPAGLADGCTLLLRYRPLPEDLAAVLFPDRTDLA